MSSQSVPVANHLTPCYRVPHEPDISRDAVREQEVHRAKLFATEPLMRVISESTSQQLTGQMMTRGSELVRSLVEAGS